MKKYLDKVSVVVALIVLGSVFSTTLAAGVVIVTNTPVILSNFSVKDCTSGMNCTPHGCHNNSNMTEITGVLVYEGMKFKIDTTILSFGCYSYLNSTISPYDFDGDGTVETILNELFGMVGTSITVKGYLSCHGTKLMVYYINGLLYRDPC